MAHIEESINVHVPVRVAYDQWTQFESWPQFMDGIKEIKQLDPTHLHFVVDVDGKTDEWDAVVTQQTPDERIAWKSTSGQPNAGVVSFYPLNDDETRITVQIDWEPQGVVEGIGNLLGFDDRQVKQDLENFKHFIEQRGAPTGAWRGTVKRDQSS